MNACSAEEQSDGDDFGRLSQDVVGGQPEALGAYPWQAQFSTPSAPHTCAGSLLNDSWVLTAAHCVVGLTPSDLTVTLGEYNRSVLEGHEQVRHALRILSHSYQQSRYWENDVALIQLDHPVAFDAWVQPIRLATADYPVGTDTVISGWGGTRADGSPTGVPLQATLPIVRQAECQFDSLGVITDANICAGFASGNPGGCYGDSGGAVVTRASDGAWEQVGIVSFGLDCASFTRLTRITTFRAFIDSVLSGGAPFYRLHSGSTGDHFYTTSGTEATNASSTFDYVREGLAGAIFPVPASGTVPLYRLFLPRQHDHFYTIYSGERDIAVRGGYSSEGTAGFVFQSQQPGTIPLYRLFNASLHDHFYTTSAAERDTAMQRFGYSDEGIAAYVLPT